MRVGASNDIADLLRSLPDMRPPDDAWQRLSRHRLRQWQRPAALSGAALAACAAIFAVVLLSRDPAPAAPVETILVATDSFGAPARSLEAPVASATSIPDVHDLRRRSQLMERQLRGLPPRNRVMRADVAATIAELQDRIAVVDYELNRRELNPDVAASARWPSARPAAVRRVGGRSGQPAHELWQERVELMDRLMRVRFVEAGAEAR